MSLLASASKTVAAAGTRERLVAVASDFSARSVLIKAKDGNAGKIYVGDSAVSSSNTPALNSGDSLSIEKRSLFQMSDIYVDAQYSGEGVDYIAAD